MLILIAAGWQASARCVNQPPLTLTKPGALHGPGTEWVVMSRPFTTTVMIPPLTGGAFAGSSAVPNCVHTIVTSAAPAAYAGAATAPAPATAMPMNTDERTNDDLTTIPSLVSCL